MISSLKALLTAALLTVSPLLTAAPVDINKADADALATNLHGVGQTKAQAIVSYRQANGPFQTPEDLTMVRGIGAGTVAKNRDSILISAQ